MSVENEIRKFLSGRGTTQASRKLPALDPASVPVDPFTESDLLTYVHRYSGVLKYYNSFNQADGDWSVFFSRDISIYIASIANTYLAGYNKEKEELARERKDAPDERSIQLNYLRFIDLISRLGAQLADWYEYFPEEEAETTEIGFKAYMLSFFKSRLGPLMEMYEGNVEEFIKPFEGIPDDIEPLVDLTHMRHTLSRIKSILKEGNYEPRPGHPNDPAEAGYDLSFILNLVFSAFYTAAQHLRLVAPSYLEKTNHYPHHQPHIALYLTFLRLLGVVRNSINRLTGRHLDYFYGEVLHLSPRPLEPDKVNLTFTLAKNAKRVIVPQGTVVTAGADPDGKDILFATDRDLHVNEGTIKSLRTIFNSGQPSTEPRYLYASPIANSADGKGKPFTNGPQIWPCFGESQYMKGPAEMTMQPAQIGFAVADHVLRMESGSCVIHFRLRLAEDSHIWLLNEVRKIKTGHGEEEINQKFARIFSEPFLISYSGPKGWVNLPAGVVSTPVLKSPPGGASGYAELEIICKLSDQFPSVVPTDPEIHGTSFTANLPVFQFVLNHSNTVYPYMPLRYLIIREIEIETEVKGFQDLTFFNDQGGLDGSKPFNPFGTSPRVGSGFYIGSKEVFSKKLSKLSLQIEWFDNPTDAEGFAGYYRAYNENDPAYGFDNFAFKANVSFLSAYKWIPAPDARQTFNLFASEGKDKRVYSEITLDPIGVQFLPAGDFPEDEEPLLLNPKLRSGFMKLELSAPAVAFGHSIYNRVVARVVQMNADSFVTKMKMWRKKNAPQQSPPPEPPFNPTIKSITLNYSAVSVQRFPMNMELDPTDTLTKAFYHIHPFGIDLARPDLGNHFPFLTPLYDKQGFLFIGLDGVMPPTQLSFLVQAIEGTGDPDEAPPTITWHYYSDNEWIPFRPEEILIDSSKGFLEAGPLVFQFPERMTRGCKALEGTEFPDGLFWIMGTVASSAGALAKVSMISTQAVTATWIQTGAGMRDPGTQLPAEKVERLKTPITGITGVTQSFPSFGGKAAETQSEYYIRVSERLRHKGRAITRWDYERLVLEKFPSLFKVKCLNHITKDGWVQPGHLTLVVIPNLIAGEEKDRKEPRASAGLLVDITRYLKSIASPFANIHVRYPSYQHLVIRVKVRFIAGLDPGTYMEELNRDLVNFLSPWVTLHGQDIAIGGKVYKSAIHDFIDKRPYVQEATDLRLYQVIKGADSSFANAGRDTRQLVEIPAHRDDAEATRPWAVLTSVRKHRIELLTEAASKKQGIKGIEDMTIGQDFQVDELLLEETNKKGINHMVIVSREAAEYFSPSEVNEGNCLRIKRVVQD